MQLSNWPPAAANAGKFASNHRSASYTQDEWLENNSFSPWTLSRSKRLVDVAIALSVLGLFALPMLAIAVCIRSTSKGPAIFKQKRIGRYGRLFLIYKFRSMTTVPAGSTGSGLTIAGDNRVTSLGRWLRRLKLDELPQFYNVLRGEMSLVGPRPKLPQYAAARNMGCRPGITGAATLAFRREEEILSRVHPSQMDSFYHQRIKPLKVSLDARYMSRATLVTDLRILASTLMACFIPDRMPPLSASLPPRNASVIDALYAFEQDGNEPYEISR